MNLHAIINEVNTKSLNKTVADIRVGETVKVHYKIREGNKERVQIFEGLVVATKNGKALQGSFTIRKVVSGIGVERNFPLHSPWIVKIERVKSGKVRRAKLNFVRRYATSSKFKLKDKGKPGTVWEQIVEQKAQSEAAQTEEQNTEVVPDTEEVRPEEPKTEPATEESLSPEPEASATPTPAETENLDNAAVEGEPSH